MNCFAINNVHNPHNISSYNNNAASQNFPDAYFIPHPSTNQNSSTLQPPSITKLSNKEMGVPYPSPNSSSGVSSGNTSPDNLAVSAQCLQLHAQLQTHFGVKEFVNGGVRRRFDRQILNARDEDGRTLMLSMLYAMGNSITREAVNDEHLIEAIKILMSTNEIDLNSADKGWFFIFYF